MIYVYCFAGSIFFAYLAERAKNRDMIILYSIISILIPSLLGGLRTTAVGNDAGGYPVATLRAALSSENLLEFMDKYGSREQGYQIVSYVTAKLFGHVNWLLFAYQLITVGCTYVGAYKHRKIAPLPFIMFMFFCMIHINSFNIIRQSMAAAIIFMGIDNMENKNYKKFMVYVIVATLFHTSAVLGGMLFISIHMVVNSKYYINQLYVRNIILYGTVAVLIWLKPLVNNIVQTIDLFIKYRNYDLLGADDPSWSMTLILIGAYIMLTFYSRGATRVFGVQGKEFYKFHTIFCIIYYSMVRIMVRAFLYSEFVDIILLAALPNFVKEKYLKAMVYLTVIAVLFFHFWFLIIIKRVNHEWPYYSILS